MYFKCNFYAICGTPLFRLLYVLYVFPCFVVPFAGGYNFKQ